MNAAGLLLWLLVVVVVTPVMMFAPKEWKDKEKVVLLGETEEEQVYLDGTVKLICNVTAPQNSSQAGQMPEGPLWFREETNGSRTAIMDDLSPKFKIQWNEITRLSMLIINSFFYVDTGRYVCEVSANSSVMPDVLSVCLSAFGPPVIMEQSGTRIDVTLYKPFHLHCSALIAENSTASVTWRDSENNILLQETINRTKVSAGVAVSTLFFTAVDEDDVQDYYCVVENEYGHVGTTLTLSGEAYAQLRDQNGGLVDMVEGYYRDSLELVCYVANFFNSSWISVRWTLTVHNGTKIELTGRERGVTISTRTEMVELHGTHNYVGWSKLIISRLTNDLAGDLSCSAGNVSATAGVCVTGKPLVRTRKMVSVQPGMTAHLWCNVSSSPPVPPDQVQWFLAEVSLNQSERYKMEAEVEGCHTWSILTIQKARYSLDNTVFICAAGNAEGTNKAFVRLVVELCPDDYELHNDSICVEARYHSFDLLLTINIAVSLSVVAVVVTCAIIFCVSRRRLLSKYRNSVERMKEREKRHNVTITFTNSASLTEDFKKLRKSESEKGQGEEKRKEEEEEEDDIEGFRAVKGPRVARDRLRLLEPLGQGTFGRVVRCEALNVIGMGRWETMAVKMCKETATEGEKNDFLKELVLLSNIPKHLNIITYYGCSIHPEPVLMLMEYAVHGDLLTYLRGRRSIRNEPEGEEEEERSVERDTNTLSAKELFAFSLQIARGMEHLANNNIVHRDMAARNVLMTERLVCKITDFGLARDVHGTDTYERKSRGLLPIRWMAPECLSDGRHSFASDVWSYGVVMWEIVTLGASPYPGLSASEVFKLVTEGYTMERPQHCTEPLYDLMVQCWSFSHLKRATFTQLCTQLERLLETEAEYIDLSLFEEKHFAVLESHKLEERL